MTGHPKHYLGTKVFLVSASKYSRNMETLRHRCRSGCRCRISRSRSQGKMMDLTSCVLESRHRHFQYIKKTPFASGIVDMFPDGFSLHVHGSIAIRPVVGRRRLGTVPIFQQAGSRRVEALSKLLFKFLLLPLILSHIWCKGCLDSWYAAEQHHSAK